MRYAALLRGVNVGGNNRVPMAELRELALGLGWSDPVTYIASGNLVFDAPRGRAPELAVKLEEAIAENLGVRCRVVVLTAATVRTVAAAIPDEWVNDADRKTDVVYLIDGISPRTAVAALDPREGVDHVVTAPGAVIWMVRRADVTRSRLQKFVGHPLYRQSTVRNANTARKLAELVAR